VGILATKSSQMPYHCVHKFWEIFNLKRFIIQWEFNGFLVFTYLANLQFNGQFNFFGDTLNLH